MKNIEMFSTVDGRDVTLFNAEDGSWVVNFDGNNYKMHDRQKAERFTWMLTRHSGRGVKPSTKVGV